MNVSAFVSALPIMGQGWLGVFIVIAVIWASIALMLRIFR